MSAFLDSIFPGGFILTEENLVKIDDLVRQRIQPIGGPPIEYLVYRNDDMLLTFDNVHEIVSQENSGRNAVVRVSQKAKNDDIEIFLDFSLEDSTTLRLRCKDRDLAFLISSDIKDYIKNEVIRKSRIPLRFLRSAAAILLPISFMAGIVSVMANFSPRNFSEALASKSLEVKLNYLIVSTSQVPSTAGLVARMIGPPIVVAMLLGLLSLTIKLYEPRAFYFGKGMQRFNQGKNFRDKIFWGVIVAFIVGIFSAYVFELIKW